MSEKRKPAIMEPEIEEVPDVGEGTGEYTGLTGPRIRCPQCDWMPAPSDTWACTCGYEWHTFDTGGVCPQCIHQWETTQCHACHAYSAHSSWYEY